MNTYEITLCNAIKKRITAPDVSEALRALRTRYGRALKYCVWCGQAIKFGEDDET